MPICNKCKKDKPAKDFYRKKGRLIRQPCISCHKAHYRGNRHKWKVKGKWRVPNRKNGDGVKKSKAAYALKANYGITHRCYVLLFRAQGGRCLICNKKSKKRLC